MRGDLYFDGIVFLTIFDIGGESNLTALYGLTRNDRELALILIKAMIADDPADRPPALAVHDHPMFWESMQILAFFQDVSDRVEKDRFDSAALTALENENEGVLRGDWRLHIDFEVASDLRKYRSYRGESVRDLLRAVRNKKNHYRELTPEVRRSLGEIPEKFTEYWLSRFPSLLSHVWCAMQHFRDEASLKQYYHSHYLFANGYRMEESKIETSCRADFPTSSIATWRTEKNTVDWSPNKTRYRGQRKKQERRKIEDRATCTLPPTSS